MDKSKSLSKNREELVHYMEKEIQSQNEVIRAQKEQIVHLKKQVALLEAQKKELADAGSMFSAKCADLENICMRQQELLEELREIFSEQPTGL